MRSSLPVAALVAALSLTASTSFGYGMWDLLGWGSRDNSDCGCGCADPGCGCDPGCDCDTACGCGEGVEGGCEVGCGCEPDCGCSDACGANGRQFAGQTWDCCQDGGPPICPCTGQDGCCQQPGGGCGDAGGCGDCCEPACGCGDCCEAGCGCEPACGCGDPCGGGECGYAPTCPLKHCGFCHLCWEIVDVLDSCCGCKGCGSELYWSEWHNDPPRCCDPCDCHGNWIGPSAGYRAPYDHPYAMGVPAVPAGPYVNNSAARQVNVARNAKPAQSRPRVARQPAKTPANSYEW